MENKVTYQARQSGKILLNANESGENLSAEMMEKVIEALLEKWKQEQEEM